MRPNLVAMTLAALSCLSACENGAPDRPASSSEAPLGLPTPSEFAKAHPDFKTYWYQGKAELTRYVLSQARYGDLHGGEAVLIFVTEDFLPKVQVKHERGDAPDALPVLKLNAYRRFYTGIYPYTIMTSTFTPVVPPRAPVLKVSTTVQEWCGQAYTQLNRRGGKLQAVVHSYFQGEADQNLTLPDATLEDGMWSRIRIDPESIRLGRQEIVPALEYIRLHHKALRAYPANVERKSNVSTELFDHPVEALIVDFPPLARKVSIYFDSAFPRVIYGWVETNGPHKTTAVRARAILDDYWNHNGSDDAEYRAALGLAL